MLFSGQRSLELELRIRVLLRDLTIYFMTKKMEIEIYARENILVASVTLGRYGTFRGL